MKALKIFEEVYQKDVIENNFSRRDAMTKGLGFGLKAALAAIPFGLLDVMTNKAKAQTAPSNTAVVAILNFALTLEYLESTYYQTGLSTSGLIPSSDTTIMMQISKHETDHVALLKQMITSLGAHLSVYPLSILRLAALTLTSLPTIRLSWPYQTPLKTLA
jgi:hypothetical protein